MPHWISLKCNGFFGKGFEILWTVFANPPPLPQPITTCDHFQPFHPQNKLYHGNGFIEVPSWVKGRGLNFRLMMYLRWISSAIIVWEMKNFDWFEKDFGFWNSSEYVLMLSLYHRETIYSNSSKINSPI